ncbi:protein FLX-like 4 [Silene latifolia]|uniref:protein FLX-like 4 n=1 Tax=Silene latifolia TaxID=37657 RepID=UPI003D784E1A
MSARGRSTVPGMMQHGQPPGIGTSSGHRPLDHPELTAQVAEIDRLLLENRKLATSVRAMRMDLGAAQDEIKRLSSHIRSTETESDIQIRVLLEKIEKMESSIKAGDGVKKDLQQAHKEAQSLLAARKELLSNIQKASQEIEMYHTDIKNIPDMISEIDGMRVEHQRLRSAFEHEKNINIDLVERMQSMESKLLAMSRELDTLRAESLKAENRAQVTAPYHSSYQNSDPQYRSLYRDNGPYYDPYSRAHIHTTANGTTEGVVPHAHANGPIPSAGAISSPNVSGASAPMDWDGTYDRSTTWK